MINPQLNPQEFPFEEHLKTINENGEMVDLKRKSKLMEVSSYWTTQQNKIGLVIGFCALVLMVVLVNESGIFFDAWSFIIETLGGLVGLK